ncbi:MAG: hypothetical protein WKF75_13660 [Singulisphaera sp.]
MPFGVSVRARREAIALAERGRVYLDGFDPPTRPLRPILVSSAWGATTRRSPVCRILPLGGRALRPGGTSPGAGAAGSVARWGRSRAACTGPGARGRDWPGKVTPAVGGMVALAASTSRAAVPPQLAAVTAAAAARFVAGGALAGVVPATVAVLVGQTLKGVLMFKGWWIGSVLMTLVLCATGVGVLASKDDGETKASARPSDAPQTGVGAGHTERSMAERFAQIRAEYEVQRGALWKAMETAKGRREEREVYGSMAPDEVAFTRCMVDLASSAPTEPAARDALIWVINKPGMSDMGAYGDEFARRGAARPPPRRRPRGRPGWPGLGQCPHAPPRCSAAGILRVG